MDRSGGSQGVLELDHPQGLASTELVGGPFAVIESDPGVFTSLIRKLGIQGIEVEEIYDIQYSLNQLKPKGLILCYIWTHDKHHPSDFLDPAATKVWFANQVIDDACGSLAILNVLFNCPGVKLGDELSSFKAETSEMSSMMKGLAISNLSSLRLAQNSLARPADVWGSKSAIAETTRDDAKAKAKAAKPAKKKRRTGGNDWTTNSSKKKRDTSSDDEVETFHFVGYVPAFGKVWELDGLKSGPLEVGELPSTGSTTGWEDVVRPALRLKMEKYGASEGGTIQFNLLALVEDRYESRSDELELLKRRRRKLEQLLTEAYGAGWREMDDAAEDVDIEQIFGTSLQSSKFGPTFSTDFGHRRMGNDADVMRLPKDELLDAWNMCIASALPAKVALENEIMKAEQAEMDNIKRTHDYEPFIRGLVSELLKEGKLAELLPQNKTTKANGRRANGKGE